jgi:hypothetical protein
MPPLCLPQGAATRWAAGFRLRIATPNAKARMPLQYPARLFGAYTAAMIRRSTVLSVHGLDFSTGQNEALLMSCQYLLQQTPDQLMKSSSKGLSVSTKPGTAGSSMHAMHARLTSPRMLLCVIGLCPADAADGAATCAVHAYCIGHCGAPTSSCSSPQQRLWGTLCHGWCSRSRYAPHITVAHHTRAARDHALMR